MTVFNPLSFLSKLFYLYSLILFYSCINCNLASVRPLNLLTYTSSSRIYCLSISHLVSFLSRVVIILFFSLSEMDFNLALRYNELLPKLDFLILLDAVDFLKFCDCYCSCSYCYLLTSLGIRLSLLILGTLKRVSSFIPVFYKIGGYIVSCFIFS